MRINRMEKYFISVHLCGGKYLVLAFNDRDGWFIGTPLGATHKKRIRLWRFEIEYSNFAC